MTAHTSLEYTVSMQIRDVPDVHLTTYAHERKIILIVTTLLKFLKALRSDPPIPWKLSLMIEMTLWST